jgi:ubiquinone/menaquinone biosynthesis C-methylase UbiE
MTTYAEKLFKGEKPTNQEWHEHLWDYHQRLSGKWEDWHMGCKTNLGGTSTEVLSQAIPQSRLSNATIIDLACGSGPLTKHLTELTPPPKKIYAIDYSPGELNIAKDKIKAPYVEFFCEPAHKLPVSNESVDIVFCHMAIMLMRPVEPVIQEIHRVLKPGGMFAAVVMDPTAFHGSFTIFLKVFLEQAKNLIPNLKAAHTSDSRFDSWEGIRSLFNSKTGFDLDPACKQYEMICYDNPRNVWNRLKTLYLCDLLASSEKEKIGIEVVKAFENEIDPCGKLAVSLNMRLFIAKKI